MSRECRRARFRWEIIMEGIIALFLAGLLIFLFPISVKKVGKSLES